MTINVSYLGSSANTGYDQGALDYVADLLQGIDVTAATVGVSSLAIAGALAEENNDYDLRDWGLDLYAQYNVDASLIFTKILLPFMPLPSSIHKRTHDEIKASYDALSERQIADYISGKERTGAIDKLTNPVLVDIGPANFKVLAAIHLVRKYADDFPSLGLDVYLDHYDKLVNDLLDKESDLNTKLYGLYLKEADDWFRCHNVYDGQWDALPQVFRDALLISFVNVGQNLFEERLAEATARGEAYEPQPLLVTGGGMNHLLNASALADAMGAAATDYTTGIQPVSNFVAQALSDAESAMAYRYALLKLRYVAVEGLDYSVWSNNGELELYDVDTDKGALTKEWINDRSAMLSWYVKGHVSDMADSDDVIRIGSPLFDTWEFKDQEKGTQIFVAPGRDRTHLVYFGDKSDSIIEGYASSDRLYGGAGNDIIKGNDGNDYIEGNSGNDTLEGGIGEDFLRGVDGDDKLNGGKGNDHLAGGAGDDTYVIKLGDGIDTIFDSDGNGTIKIDGMALAGGIKDSANAWLSEDKKYRYVLIEEAEGTHTLQVFPAEGNGSGDPTLLYIKKFTSGNLGINLQDPPEPDPQQVRTINGDVEPRKTTHTNADGSTYETIEYDALGNIVGTSGGQPGADMLLGSGGMDDIHGGIGNDTLYGKDGDDKVAGEDGSDLIAGGLGRDDITGGDGNDILYGDSIHNTPGLQAGTRVETPLETPPFESEFVDSGIGWSRYRAETDNLPPVSNGNPSAVTPVLVQLNPTRFGYVNLVYSDVTEYGQGVGGDDVIKAGIGNDTLYGEAGNDLLSGESGEDKLHGGSGNDLLNGGEDDDLLMGDGLVYAAYRWNTLDLFGRYRTTPQVETYENEFGNDLLFGGAGSDYLFGMAGADILYGESGNDYLVGDFYETVSIPVYHYNDASTGLEYDFSTHFEEAVQYHGNDILDGGEGDDYLVGLAGDDQLSGGAGADVLVADGSVSEVQGRYGNDYLDGGDDNDFLLGSGGEDELHGGAGNDTLWGDEYAGADGQPLGSWGEAPFNSSDSGGQPEVLDQDKHGKDFLDGGDGNDTMTGGGFDDYLDGGKGNDLLFGDGSGVTNEGEDLLFGGEGDDELQGGGGDDFLSGDEGNDRLWGGDGNDVLTAAAGEDYLEGGAGDDGLDGGDNNDALWGNEGDDTLSGGSGDDFLIGGEGNDTLTGGTGRDVMQGGEGDDTYLLHSGDGAIISNVFETIDDTEGSNVLRFEGVSPSSITLRQAANPDDLALQYGSNDGIYIKGGMGGAIQSLDFGSGPISWQGFFLDHMMDAVSVAGSDAGVSLVGGRGDDTLSALRQSSLTGGVGNDSLTVTGDCNVFVYRAGDGVDTLYFNYTPTDVSALNSIRFGEGITADDLQLFIRAGGTNDVLEIRLGDDPNSALLLSGFNRNDLQSFGSLISLEFADGSVMSYAQLLERGYALIGSADADVLSGSSIDDRIEGGAGNDVIDGGDGNDLLAGGLDKDILSGGLGVDTLLGGMGDDALTGGAGNDALNGGEGLDTYVFDAGFGEDRIADAGTNTVQFNFDFAGAGIVLGLGSLKISFANHPGDVLHIDGFDPEDPLNTSAITTFKFADRTFTLSQLLDIGFDLTGTSGDDFIQGKALLERINALEGNDTVHAGRGNDIVDGGAGDDHLEGEDGNDLLQGNTGNDVLLGGNGTDALSGGDGDDALDGGDGSDVLRGEAGSDMLSGGYGDDTLSGGEGADTLNGGIGQDTYLLDAGFGEDRIVDTGTNTARFNFDSANAGIFLSLAAGSLKIGFANRPGDTLYIDGFDPQDPLHTSSITTFHFSDRSFTLAELLDIGFDVSGTAEADVISGTALLERINALEGNDIVRAGSGNDIVDGGMGDDSLEGEDGNDVLLGGAGNDALLGGEGADTLSGGIGNDLLDGGTGLDTLAGGAGDDSYVVESTFDRVMENVDEGVDSVQSSISHTLDDNVENLVLLGSGALNGAGNAQDNAITGNAANNTLSGYAGNDVLMDDAGDDVLQGGVGMDTLMGGVGFDVLDGGEDADVMAGGSGDDVYVVDNIGDVIVEDAASGNDEAQSSISYQLADNLEKLTLTGTSAINGTGNAADNTLIGNNGNNILDGGAGADGMAGLAGDDIYVVDHAGDIVTEALNAGVDTVKSSISYTAAKNVENVVLTGGAALNGTGNTLNNALTGNDEANTLTGLQGNDTIGGGAGDDVIYGDGQSANSGGVAAPGTSVTSNLLVNALGGSRGFGEGLLARNDDGSTGRIDITSLFGPEGLNFFGGQRTSLYVNNNGNITFTAANWTFTPGAINAGFNNPIIAPFWGDVDTRGSTVVPSPGGNSTGSNLTWYDLDPVKSTFTVTWDDVGYYSVHTDKINAFQLQLIGVGDGDFDIVFRYEDISWTTGDASGGFGGLGGAVARAGYSAGDGLNYFELSQSGNQGAILGLENTIGNTGVAGVYVFNVRNGQILVDGNDVLDGGEGNDTLFGNGGNDSLSGGSGNDTLNGGSGFDVMVGGSGNDIYVVDSVSDVVTEALNAGADEVRSSVSYSLSESVENMTLTGAVAINGTGNDLSNSLVGNDAANVLNGGAGLDTLSGGLGDDIYVVDGNYVKVPGDKIQVEDCCEPVALAEKLQWTTDTVIEQVGAGYDTVRSSASYVMADGIERLELTFDPTLAVTAPQLYADLMAFGQDGTGNELDNVIAGDQLRNRLDGGAGADVLQGGAGDDTYVVDQAADLIIEQVNAGVDTVEASFSYALDNLALENLTLLDGATWGRGNDADNVLVGNSVDNMLEGLAGNDVLVGGAGDDTLLGGEGDDRYVFRLGDGVDRIDDTQGINALCIGSDLTVADLEAVNVGNDVVISIVGTNDSITLVNWLGQSEGVNRIEFCEDVPLDRAGIEALLNKPPVAVADSITAYEDGGVVVTPTIVLLANDTDPNPNDELTVISAGTSTLGMDVSLINGLVRYDIGNRFQELGREAVLHDSFGYEISDRMGAAADSVVNVDIVGTNDAPILVKALVDQAINFNKPFSWQLPVNSFTDIDQGDALDYTATLANGSPLPDWLKFDAATLTFSGMALNEAGFADIRVIATDRVAASGSTTGSLSVSDVFRLSVVHGNEGVGNGQDTPPPGQSSNFNDGPGTSPGTPGAPTKTIFGTAGNEVLYGTTGNDVLDGGVGTDTLVGGLGNDCYVFNRGDGSDTITDTDATVSNMDVLRFGKSGVAINYDQLWFTQTGNTLEVSVIGTSDKVTINNWYDGTSNHVEQIQLKDGHYLLDNQVAQLVEAMAGMMPPPMGQTTLSAVQQQQLESVLASSWHTA